MIVTVTVTVTVTLTVTVTVMDQNKLCSEYFRTPEEEFGTTESLRLPLLGWKNKHTETMTTLSVTVTVTVTVTTPLSGHGMFAFDNTNR
jgi:hypothetical protein